MKEQPPIKQDFVLFSHHLFTEQLNQLKIKCVGQEFHFC